MVARKKVGGIDFNGITGKLAGSQITGNMGNAITGKYSGRLNVEQVPEKSVIGNL